MHDLPYAREVGGISTPHAGSSQDPTDSVSGVWRPDAPATGIISRGEDAPKADQRPTAGQAETAGATMKPEHVHGGQPMYPAGLARLVGDAPASVAAIGPLDILSRENLAIFCSVKCPGDLILATYDLVCHLRDKGEVVIGGFHSPMEQECLKLLLRGRQPVIVCPARSIEKMRLPAEWRQPMADGRLLILSPFDAKHRRQTAALAEQRNEFVAALADRVFIAHAAPGGRTERLARQAIVWGKPLLTLAGPENLNLIALGARIIGPEANAQTLVSHGR